MELKIKNSNDFEKLLNSLINDLTQASIYYRLLLDLKSQLTEYSKEFNESNTFWWLTFNALQEAAMFRLCRVYEMNKISNNLLNLLDTIKANLYIFDEEYFRARLKDNPFVDSLAEIARKPNIHQLDKDIEYIKRDSLVNNLFIWRNNIIAHRSANIILKSKNLSDNFPITTENISELIEKGISILNHYNNLFRATSQSTQVVGHDDYKHVLSSIRRDSKRRKEEIEAEIEKYKTKL